MAVSEDREAGELSDGAAADLLHGDVSAAGYVHRQHYGDPVPGCRDGGAGQDPVFRPGAYDPGGNLLRQSGRIGYHVRRPPQHHHRHVPGAELLRLPGQHWRYRRGVPGVHGGVFLPVLPQASGRKRKEPPGQCGVPRRGVGGEEPGGLLWLRRIVPGGGGPADHPRPDGADGGHHRLHRRSADESCDAVDQRKKGCRRAVCPGGL